MQASSKFLRRMFLTFFWRIEPAERVAKPACIRKISAPAHSRKKVLFSEALSFTSCGDTTE
jgi:hypothetical protein